MFKINQVPKRFFKSAVKHLASGSDNFANDLQFYRDAVRNLHSDDFIFCWSTCSNVPVAAVLIVKFPGKVGFLYHSRLDSQATDHDQLAKTIDFAKQIAFSQGISFIQLVIEPDQKYWSNWLNNAGFTFIADIHHMRYDLQGRQNQANLQALLSKNGYVNANRYKVVPASMLSKDQLAKLIAKTYENSLDCPIAARYRPASDSLETHINTGNFMPDWWSVATIDNKPVGCALVNFIEEANSGQLVYLGVVNNRRKLGIANNLIRRSMQILIANSVQYFELSVDAKNHLAIRVYRNIGFQIQAIKSCFALFKTV